MKAWNILDQNFSQQIIVQREKYDSGIYIELRRLELYPEEVLDMGGIAFPITQLDAMIRILETYRSLEKSYSEQERIITEKFGGGV